MTRTISGAVTSRNIPLEGVSVSADHGGGTGTTNAEGKYEVLVDYGWSGTITPTKEGYIFDPASKTYTNVTENQKEDADELLRKAAERRAAERRAAEERARGPEPEEALVPELPEELLISNVFVDTDLRQALQDIAFQVGVIIIALFFYRLNSEEQASPCVSSAKS